jgi:hypothetical protein
MFRIFNTVYAAQPTPAYAVHDSAQALIAAAQPDSYAARTLLENRAKTAALILHDVGSKDERKDWVEDFKAGKIDLLFVYNMLLTGFDAKRLKKLYLGRIIKAHNLLQALTRGCRSSLLTVEITGRAKKSPPSSAPSTPKSTATTASTPNWRRWPRRCTTTGLCSSTSPTPTANPTNPPAARCSTTPR